MKNRLSPYAGVCCILFYLAGCSSNPSYQEKISDDPAVIAAGKSLFLQQCSGCHNFKQDGIGPQLGGVTKELSPGWIRNFIKNPDSVVKSDDEQGKKLFAKYKTLMPPFSQYSNEDLNRIIAYLNTQEKPESVKPFSNATAISDPIPEKIKFSGLTVNLKLVTQIPASGKTRPYTRITKMAVMPGTARMFIVDLRGKLYEMRNGKPEVYLDLAKLKPDFIDQPGLATGFGSFAFHPDFLKNGLLYTTHTEKPGSGKADFQFSDTIPKTVQWVLTEWKTDHPGAFPFSGKSRELFRINMVTGIHGVQEITFNPYSQPGDEDYGLLYIGIGDGGAAENGYTLLCHNLEKPWGTIFRIDPSGNNSANHQYGIPAGNPFANDNNSHVLKEIYAYGFRNPHRITWTKSGKMLAVNIGMSNIESVDWIKAGHDYGWPVREGTFLVNPYGDINKVYPLPPDDSLYQVTYPVAMYDHDEGHAITGGYEYTGSAVPGLAGKFLFGDIVTGRLFYINLADVKQGSQAPVMEWKISYNGKPITMAELCGNNRVDLRFGKDQKGEMYLLCKQDGKIYRLAGINRK